VRIDHVSNVFETHYQSLYRYLIRFSGDADLAADAAQETFIRLMAQPPNAQIERGWRFKVATNHVLESWRTTARRRRLLRGRIERTMADPPPDPAEFADAELQRRRVSAALKRLKDKERIAVLMREEGFSHREIADAVGTTTGSIGTLLARALARLARELQPEEP